MHPPHPPGFGKWNVVCGIRRHRLRRSGYARGRFVHLLVEDPSGALSVVLITRGPSPAYVNGLAPSHRRRRPMRIQVCDPGLAAHVPLGGGGAGHLGLTHTETQRDKATDGLWTEACGQQKQSNDPDNNQHNPQHANHWAPLTRKRHIPPHPTQPRHTNNWAPRTRKRHQQEHRPQRPTERSDPTQHAKGRTGDCPGPREGATTRRNVTQGGGLGIVFRIPSARAAWSAFTTGMPQIMSRGGGGGGTSALCDLGHGNTGGEGVGFLRDNFGVEILWAIGSVFVRSCPGAR